MYGEDFEKELDRYDSRFPEDRRRAALLLALHAVQDREGWIRPDAVTYLAERYDISEADVRGVISFYTMFFDEDPGQHVIWLCRTFSCELMGAGAVMEAFEETLGCKVGGTDPTGTFHLRWMECLAACDKAPCALIDDHMYETLTKDAVKIVLEHVKSGGRGGAIRTSPSGEVELQPLQPTGGPA